MTRAEADQWLTNEAGFEALSPDEWFLRSEHHLLVFTYSKNWRGDHWTLSVYIGSQVQRRFRGSDPREVWSEYIFH